MASKNNKELFEILQHTAATQLQIQADSINSIESKIGTIISSIGVFFPIIIAVITNSEQITWNLWLALGMCAFLLVVGINIFTLVAREFRISPDINKFYHTFENQKNPNKVREEALKSMFLAIDYNGMKIKQKGKLFNYSLIALGIGILLFLVGIFVQVPINSNVIYNYSIYARHQSSK